MYKVISGNRQFVHQLASANKTEPIKTPHHWLFLKGIHRWPVSSYHKGHKIYMAYMLSDDKYRCFGHRMISYIHSVQQRHHIREARYVIIFWLESTNIHTKWNIYLGTIIIGTTSPQFRYNTDVCSEVAMRHLAIGVIIRCFLWFLRIISILTLQLPRYILCSVMTDRERDIISYDSTDPNTKCYVV